MGCSRHHGTNKIRRAFRPDQHDAERGRQGKSYEGGKGDGDDDGQRELPVKDARHARQERHGNEHRRQHEGRRQHRAFDLFHGRRRRLADAAALFEVLLHALDDHDRVVHHHADGQHHREQCQRVDGKTGNLERGKGGDQRDGNRQHGDNGGARIAQEQVHDRDDERQRLPKGIRYFLHRLRHIAGAVNECAVLHVRREGAGLLRENRVDLADGLDGVGVVRQGNAEGGGFPPVLQRNIIHVPYAVGDLRHVPEPHIAAVRLRAEDDARKVFRRFSSICGAADGLGFLPFVGGHLAQRTDGGSLVLLLDGVGDVRHREPVRSELFRVQPDPHGEIIGVLRDGADTVDTLDLVHEIHLGIVFQEHAVITAVRRDQRNDQRHVRGAFRRGDAVGLHLVGQLRQRRGDAVLHLDRGGVAVDLRTENDFEVIGSRGIGSGLHIVDALDAVHLVLDDLRHRVVEHFRVSADISGGNHHRGRCDFRVLGDGQRKRGQQPEYGQKQRGDNRRQWMPDKKSGHE